MNPALFLSKYKTSNWDFSNASKSTSIKPNNTNDAGLYGIPKKCFAAGMLKYGLDTNVIDYLHAELLDKASELKQRERWRKPPEGMLSDLCTLAIAETLKPRDFRFQVQRFDSLGISQDSWRSTWRPRYEAIFQILNEWANYCYRQLGRRLNQY